MQMSINNFDELLFKMPDLSVILTFTAIFKINSTAVVVQNNRLGFDFLRKKLVKMLVWFVDIQYDGVM